MKREMKIKVFVIILIIMFLFLISRIYCWVIVNNVFKAIMEFKKEDNRAYFVDTLINGNINLRMETFLKQDKIKYISKKENLNLDCIWKDFEINKQYSFNVTNKELYMNDIFIQDKRVLLKLPNFIDYIFQNNKLNIIKLLDIYYILPTKYNDKSCYKIVTKNETIIIDKETYLPVYSLMKLINSDRTIEGKIENIYEFKVGEVTDEDVALPDLSEYTLVK